MAEKEELEALREVIGKSEDDFEKKILYIGSGALLLSLTLLDKIIKLDLSYGVAHLIIGWVSLVLSLIINLMSHLISKLHMRRAQEEIFNKVSYEIRTENHKKSLRTSDIFNWTSTSLLIIGISMILIFASINALHPQKVQDLITPPQSINLNQPAMSPREENENEGEIRIVSNPDSEKKSYSIPDPREFADDPVTTERPSKPVQTEE